MSVTEIKDRIRLAVADVDTQPTEGQAHAGNYAKGHVRLHGLDISIENPKGSSRSGVGPDGKRWVSTMRHHYGYIKGTEGKDGDHLDVFVGPHPESELVTVVNQVDPKTGVFDEHKVMLGFVTEADAKAGYLANYEKGWKGLGSLHTLSMQDFKTWLENRSQKRPLTKSAGGPGSGVSHDNTAPLTERPKSDLVSIGTRSRIMQRPADRRNSVALERIKYVAQDKYVIKKLAGCLDNPDDWREKPIKVLYDGSSYHLMDGHHRFLAALRLGMTRLPADVWEMQDKEKTAHLMTMYDSFLGGRITERRQEKTASVLLNPAAIGLYGAGVAGLLSYLNQRSGMYSGRSRADRIDPYLLARAAVVGGTLGMGGSLAFSHLKGFGDDVLKSVSGARDDVSRMARSNERISDAIGGTADEWADVAREARNLLSKARTNRMMGFFKKGSASATMTSAATDSPGGSLFSSRAFTTGLLGAGLGRLSHWIVDDELMRRAVKANPDKRWVRLRALPWVAGGAVGAMALDTVLKRNNITPEFSPYYHPVMPAMTPARRPKKERLAPILAVPISKHSGVDEAIEKEVEKPEEQRKTRMAFPKELTKEKIKNMV